MNTNSILKYRFHRFFWLYMLVLGSIGLAGCPEVPGWPNPPTGHIEYDRGFNDGFADDNEYWLGFYDSWDTVDGGEIYYTGHEIPYIDDYSYEAGYWDGIWFAYHDGYFVAYDYAFTIGFSDGYDATYRANWRSFLNNDEHVEWLDGGFSDGYNDGFSEGRVFGVYDYETGLPFDWLDAMLDYRAGTDVLLDSFGVILGTGEYGPVYLYEYGTDPFELIYGKSENATPNRAGSNKPAIRASHDNKLTINQISYRDMINDVREELNVRYKNSPRGNIDLTLQNTWLNRVEMYLNEYKSNGKHDQVSTRSNVLSDES